jgi:hypothetical protein
MGTLDSAATSRGRQELGPWSVAFRPWAIVHSPWSTVDRPSTIVPTPRRTESLAPTPKAFGLVWFCSCPFQSVPSVLFAVPKLLGPAGRDRLSRRRTPNGLRRLRSLRRREVAGRHHSKGLLFLDLARGARLNLTCAQVRSPRTIDHGSWTKDHGRKTMDQEPMDVARNGLNCMHT